MNRRELFKRLAGATAAAGIAPIAAEAHEAPCDPKRALVVVSLERHFSVSSRQHILDAWNKVTAGTAWEGVRAIVLDAGMKLEVHDLARFGGKR